MQNGITLIALVVTIVVLLILAGVSINLVIGQNGIITKAGDAKKQTEQATANDQAAMSGLYDEMKEYLGELPSTNYTTPYLPTGFSKVEGTNLDTGLVIQDGAGNQYVWVEVPKTDTVYPTAGLGITTFNDTAYTKIEADLHTYTNTYRNGTSYTDTYYEDTDNTGWFADATAYNTAKNNMLKSVYENGGFYVGRYETGIAYDDVNGPRDFGEDYTTLHEATQTPVIKANAYPYNWVRRTQAQVLASNMYSGDRTSSLMFGVQWDLVLAFMHNKGGVADSVLTSDSKTIGNYADAEIEVTNTNAKYAICSQDTWVLGSWNNILTSYTKPDSGTENGVLLTTGANETRNSKMNICDLAGNVFEWTLEYTSYANGPCVSRGGTYTDVGSSYAASGRYDIYAADTYDSFGFRVSLY